MFDVVLPRTGPPDPGLSLAPPLAHLPVLAAVVLVFFLLEELSLLGRSRGVPEPEATTIFLGLPRPRPVVVPPLPEDGPCRCSSFPLLAPVITLLCPRFSGCCCCCCCCCCYCCCCCCCPASLSKYMTCFLTSSSFFFLLLVDVFLFLLEGILLLSALLIVCTVELLFSPS